MTNATRPKWLPTSGPGNMEVPPEKWGMQIKQWAAFIVACALKIETWDELEASEDRKEAGYVNLYQLVDHFVKPWTRNTGNSVALLMNSEKPLKAELFVSHAWGACLHETLVAVLGKAMVLGISLDVPMWFCGFAQYQPGDMDGDCGPGVAAQLALDPFGSVIASKPPYGMLVVHTSRAELYGRLWCVFEVNAAQGKDVDPSASLSMKYMTKLCARMTGPDDMEHLQVSTENANCWSPDDAVMIKAKVESEGGFGQLNDKIYKFRSSSFSSTLAMFLEFDEWFKEFKDGGDGDEAIQFISEGVRNAALWMGLHCLAPLVEAVEDEESGQQMLGIAKELILYFQGEGFQLPEGCPPPPRFDMNKAAPPGSGPDTDVDADVWDALKSGDGVFTTMMIGLLEMGAGGSEIVKIRDATGAGQAIMESREGDDESIKEIFRQWDTDGSGKISKEEMSDVLRALNPNFTEQDIEMMFAAADKNQDGEIDFEEFIDWLSAKK
mmetsp:Transcript_79867/g.171163  ORF Transcript_79867/g.171163 Transcript_79867/m.171163 type:complete len:495 (-) Transcript_79867:68-1552(-)